MIRTLSHQFIEWTCYKSHSEFVRSLGNLENTQLTILHKLTGSRDYESFKKLFHVTSYSEWRETIEERRITEKNITQFVPTSGSTQKLKWIPYTKEFKSELWKATAPWLYDIYNRHPKIKQGTHFWSLSWLPQDLRHDHQTDDLDFFVGMEKIFLQIIMTMPKSAANAPTLEDSMKEALLALINKDVTLISIWSPTFLLELLDFLFVEKEYFLSLVDERTKDILLRHKRLSPAFTKELFPELILISSWATSTSAHYAGILQNLFSHAKFEAKGLWATEGVVTIPYKGHFPLAVNSHFYEFIVENTGEVLPSWELKQGMKVSPLLSTSGGLLRYRLNDLLLVDEFVEKTPCFKFLGRINEVDLVGEKIASELAAEILSVISNEFPVKAISLMAFIEPHPHYMILVEGRTREDLLKNICGRTEELLEQNFHYKLARELHQLSECRVLCSEKAMDDYLRFCEKQVSIRGNIKLEPLLLVRGSQNE
ncbi:MAG: GH3 auxin-responsive promoter family protein [Bacteriovorax sp.]|jgi:hypothetical protein